MTTECNEVYERATEYGDKTKVYWELTLACIIRNAYYDGAREQRLRDTPEIADLLVKLKWIDQIRFGCDTPKQVEECNRAIDMMRARGCRNKFLMYTMLHGEIDECYERLTFWRKKGNQYNVQAQPYINLQDLSRKPPQWQKDMARWANQKVSFHSAILRIASREKASSANNILINKQSNINDMGNKVLEAAMRLAIKEGQEYGDYLADILRTCISNKIKKDKGQSGLIITTGVLHACATILVNGFADEVSVEERLKATKEYVTTYFDMLKAENIFFKENE